jgi:two-component system sensor histidine kinase DegS
MREAISNIEQHAQAKIVNLSLLWEEPDLIITLEDDGVGFNPDALSGFGHFGIQIMKQRADEINGSIEISSTLDQGVKIILRCPLTVRKALLVE